MGSTSYVTGSTSFGPAAFKVVTQAFDDTWNSIAADFGDDPLAIKEARLKLANVVLEIAYRDRSDPEQIKQAALQVMAQDTGIADRRQT